MPRTRSKHKKKKPDFFATVPNFKKDIEDIRKGRIDKLSPVQAYVQARGQG